MQVAGSNAASPKTRKTKAHRPATDPSGGMALKMDEISTGIPGTNRRVRRGRKARRVRKNVKWPNSGKKIGTLVERAHG